MSLEGVSDEDEQLCMSYALGTLDGSEKEEFEVRLKESPVLLGKVSEFETLYAERELEEAESSNSRLKEAIMTQITGDQSTPTPSNDGTQPMLPSQALSLLAFGVVIVVACFLAFGVSL